jgi:hypothetical protein
MDANFVPVCGQLWKDMGIQVDFKENKIIGPDKRIIGNIVED